MPQLLAPVASSVLRDLSPEAENFGGFWWSQTSGHWVFSGKKSYQVLGFPFWFEYTEIIGVIFPQSANCNGGNS